MRPRAGLALLVAGLVFAAVGLVRARDEMRCVAALEVGGCGSPNLWLAVAALGVAMFLFGVVMLVRGRRARIV